jgi:predicted metal-dependent hydrolase
MQMRVQLGDIAVDVVRKDIKNVHLSVYPPAGKVRIAAPERMSLETIRVFAISKLAWIRQQQRKLQEQERETLREYLDRESHYVWGKRCLLKIVEAHATPSVEMKHNRLILRVRPGTDELKKRVIVEGWYREHLKIVVPPLIAKWEPRLGVKVARVFVQRMKTKWGSCNSRSRNIRLNTDLAKKPRECLEYIIVHEIIHLRERHHNDNFAALMNRFLPQWKLRREELNAAPLAHVRWNY